MDSQDSEKARRDTVSFCRDSLIMIHDPGDMGALHPAGSALAGAGESAAQGDRPARCPIGIYQLT